MKRIEVKLDKVSGSEHEGYFLDSSSYDRVIDEDCEVFDSVTGEKLVDFRKGSLSGHLSEEYFPFFKSVAKITKNENRGYAAGRDLEWKVGNRTALSTGQKNVIERGKNKRNGFKSFDQIEEILAANTDPANFFWLKRSEDRKDWEGFLDKIKEADPSEWPGMFKKYRKEFVDPQARGKRCYSNVFGAFGRTGRNPYCRLSLATSKNPEKYYEYADLYQKVDEISANAFPEKHAKMAEGLANSHNEYTLLGTAFTTITVNWNFRLASHFDGRNFPEGFATLTVFEKGDFTGQYLVFPEIRLAFNLREGDTISADTCHLLHGNTAKEGEGERVSLVFFTRKDIADKCHSKDLDLARKAFCAWSKENLVETHGNGRAQWQGNFKDMFDSPEWYSFWENYKQEKGIADVKLTENDKMAS